MTEQEEKDLAKVNAKQEKESYAWMAKNLHRYKPDKRVSGLMADYLFEHQLPWESNSLDEAFDHLLETGQIEEVENDDAPVLKATPAPTPTLPPWGFVISRSAIREMDARTMKQHMTNKMYGREFTQAVNALKFTRGEIQ